MRLIRERPPLFERIAEVFDVRGKPVLFAWGDVIYAPSGVSTVAPQLVDHERVHGLRQLRYLAGDLARAHDPSMASITAWWLRYLSDPVFRLEEEKPAHIAEYRKLCEMLPSRSDRRRHLSLVSGRLASPLYRYSITKDEAREVLKDGYR